jgi:hypothetical protein
MIPMAIAASRGFHNSAGEEVESALPPFIPIARSRNVDSMEYRDSGIRTSNLINVANRATTNAITGAVRMLSTRMLEKIMNVSLS